MTLALITNDDGIDSHGLDALAQVAIDAGLEVLVAAPMRDCSGMSAAVFGDESDVQTAVAAADSSRLPGVEMLSVNGTPGLIARAAMHGVYGRVPDVVLSGINLGENYGSNIIHSGTVGAALTGAMNGARALAVSLDVTDLTDPPHWNACTLYIEHVLPWLLRSNPGTTLSMNVPDSAQVRGLRQAHLATFSIVEPFASGERDATVSAFGSPANPADRDGASPTDVDLLQQDYATITQLVAAHEVIDSDLSELNTDMTAGM